MNTFTVGACFQHELHMGPHLLPDYGSQVKFYDSRRWLKFKLDHSPLFSSATLKMAIAAVKVIWISSDGKTGESKVGT